MRAANVFKIFSLLKTTLNVSFVEFPTNRTELNAVFDIFDRNASGEIDYREFVDALRPERQVRFFSSLYCNALVSPSVVCMCVCVCIVRYACKSKLEKKNWRNQRPSMYPLVWRQISSFPRTFSGRVC